MYAGSETSKRSKSNHKLSLYMVAIRQWLLYRAPFVLLLPVILTFVVITWPEVRTQEWASRVRLLRQTYLPLKWPPLHHGLFHYYSKEKLEWIEEPVSPYNLSQLRQSVLSTSPPQAYPFDAQNPPGIALLFLVLGGIDHASLWQRWMEDAFAHFRNITNNALDPKKYIRGYIHHPTWVKRDIVEEGTPHVFRQGILAELAECIWGNLNPCVAQLIQHALEAQGNAQWFIMVSADAVPLKPFRDMYNELIRDKRTRMTFLDLYFHKGLPRVCNWFILSRAHAHTLIRRRNEWMNGVYIAVSRILQGAADEFEFFSPLLAEYGEDLFQTINPGMQMTDREVARQQLSTPLYNCWRSLVCLAVGKMEPGSEPAKYLSLKEAGLKPLFDDPQVFFLRKVNRDSVVYLSSEATRNDAAYIMPTLSYLSEHMNLSSTAVHKGVPRPPIEMPPGYREEAKRLFWQQSRELTKGRVRRANSSSGSSSISFNPL